jgi:Tol biopolymer transport system component
MGDWGNTIRVMNASGSGSRMLVGWSPVPRPEGEVVAEVEGQNISCCVGAFAWSGDGERLAFQTTGEIWIVGVDGDGFTRVGVGGGMRWSPTAPRLAFRSEGAIWFINVDGSGLTQVAPAGYDPVWSPDGEQLAYRDGGSLYVVDADGMKVQTLIAVEPTAAKSSCAQQQTPHCIAPVVWNPALASASGS